MAGGGGGDDDGGAGWDGRKKLTVWRLDFPCPSYLLCVAVSVGAGGATSVSHSAARRVCALTQSARQKQKQAGELLVVEEDSEEAQTLMPKVPIAYIAPRNVDPSLLKHAFAPTARWGGAAASGECCE